MGLRRIARKVIRIVIPWSLIKGTNRLLRRLAAWGHWLQYFYEWRVMASPPEWFDQNIDLYWKWHATRNPTSWERGIFSLLAMRQGCRVLDLCCGTGFYSYYFYSGRASTVVALDHGRQAIAQAKRSFKTPNLEFRQADIRVELPEGEFDNVILNATLEYFTPTEAHQLIRNMKSRLVPKGILSGNSIVAQHGLLAHPDQKQAFYSSQELAQFLQQHFINVAVLTTRFLDPGLDRTNLYFFASDGPVPLLPGWPAVSCLSRAPENGLT